MLKNGKLACDMLSDCTDEVTHIESKGYVYCTGHGKDRKGYGHRVRKLRPHEVRKLERSEPIRY